MVRITVRLRLLAVRGVVVTLAVGLQLRLERPVPPVKVTQAVPDQLYYHKVLVAAERVAVASVAVP